MNEGGGDIQNSGICTASLSLFFCRGPFLLTEERAILLLEEGRIFTRFKEQKGRETGISDIVLVYVENRFPFFLRVETRYFHFQSRINVRIHSFVPNIFVPPLHTLHMKSI